MLIFGKQLEPLFQENDELVGHLVEFVGEAVSVDIAKAGADGIVDEHDVGELGPRSVIIHQRMVVFESVGANFHQCAILRATPRTAVQPDHRPLLVGDVLVLEVPEKDVAVVLGGDLDVAIQIQPCVSFSPHARS